MKSSFYTVLLLALLAACVPPGDKPHAEQDAQIVQTAENLKQSGDAAGAVRVLREAEANQPDDPLILSQLGSALLASGQPQEAVSVFDRLITLHPDNVSAYNGKGIALDRAGNHAAAQESYRQALKLSPDSLSVKNNLAMSMILSDQFDQAIPMLEALNRQSGTNQIVRQNLALAYGIKGDKEKALALNLQDLPQAEAEENMRFYEQYAREHKKPAAPITNTAKTGTGGSPFLPAKTASPDAAPVVSLAPSLHDVLSPAAAAPGFSFTPDAMLPPPAAAPKHIVTPLLSQPPAAVLATPAIAAKNKSDDKTDTAPSPSDDPFPFHLTPDSDTTYPSQGKR